MTWYPSTASSPTPGLRIGDVARELDVTIPTIRHWLTQFPMATDRLGGQRRFSQGNINRLRLVKQLVHREGYSILAARKHLLSLISCRW